MKAVLCTEHGPPTALQFKGVPSLKPTSKNSVVVQVLVAGVNFPDTLIIEGKYQFQPPLPFSPGGEVSGIIKEVGSGVKHLVPGQKVVAFTGWGGFAEEVEVDSSKVIPLPDRMDPMIGAAFVMTYGTSYHALKDRAALKECETLLVLGASGGVGLAAVELGKLMGAKVIACASSDDKLETCKKYGADHLVNYTLPDWEKKIKQICPAGVDVVYDPIGDIYSEKLIRQMAWNGRFLVVGFAAGQIPAIKINLLLLKGCSLVGVFWGRFTATQPKENAQQLKQLTEWQLEGKIKPYISKSYPLHEAPQALQDLKNRKVQGKVVLLTRHYHPSKH
eukprot:TRINITY_DN4176_c0_g1_i1.p1 TRINITY_DN4176_c0_g1~~TRINITY_DN4176_c0_g1_i1.p1  ORF type:complete len:333 (+),score=71.68 TRINITY_DN4176_c0_g1_i1:118-1116(+)